MKKTFRITVKIKNKKDSKEGLLELLSGLLQDKICTRGYIQEGNRSNKLKYQMCYQWEIPNVLKYSDMCGE